MHELPPHVPWVFGGLLVAMVLALALEEKLHAKKSVITGVFAVLALGLGAWFHILPFGAVTLPNGHHVDMPVYIPAVDWGVITIILGSSLFIDVVSHSGLFTWTAVRLTRMSGGDPLQLLLYYGVLTVVFSAVLNNVTAMIIVGSLTAVSLGKLGKNNLLLGFLLTEGLLTNIGGLLTLISSVPNIILGNMAQIPFMRFFVVAAPYALTATALTLFLAVRLFGIRALDSAEERVEAERLVNSFDPNDAIESPLFFRAGWLLLAGFILTISTTSALPIASELGMGFVAMAWAGVALIRFKHTVHERYSAMDWDLLFFFIYLFVVINVAEHAGVLEAIGSAIGMLLEMGDVVGGTLLLWAAAIASSVTDNVPLAAVLGKVLLAKGVPSDSHIWWCCIFGANLGGNFTPIGSASTVVAVSVMHKHKVPMTFGSFVKLALPFALAHVTLATAYVMLFLR